MESKTGLERAFSFLTVLGGSSAPAPNAVTWFPIVGLIIGVAVGVVWHYGALVFGPVVGSLVAIGADLLITGMIHIDGLGDFADGMFAHFVTGSGDESDQSGQPDQQTQGEVAFRLEVMGDPGLGAFGVTTVVLVILARFAALVTLSGGLRSSVLICGGLWCASRSIMALGLGTMEYARPAGGLASAFGARHSSSRVIIRNFRHTLAGLVGLCFGVAVLAVWHWNLGLVAGVVGFITGALVLTIASRRIGGFTGDVLGAAGLSLESVGLILLCAHWGAI